MIKLLYKFIGLIFTAFIFFIFTINYNFMSFKDSILVRIYYSIKINIIYYIFYLVYIYFYIKYIYIPKKNKYKLT